MNVDHWATNGGRQDWHHLLTAIDKQTSAIEKQTEALREHNRLLLELLRTPRPAEPTPEPEYSEETLNIIRQEAKSLDQYLIEQPEPTAEEWANINKTAEWLDPLLADKERDEFG